MPSLPKPESLEATLVKEPSHPLAPVRAELLQAMRVHGLVAGRILVPHHWRNTCVLACAFRQEIPLTVHPGIGYDIIANHPMFNGAAIGRAAEIRCAWVKFPALSVEPSLQRYERLGERDYRYTNVASGFSALVTVDELALPVSYEGVWTRIADWQGERS